MEITVAGNVITLSEPGTLSHLREVVASGPGPFTVSSDGVYFVNEIPVLITYNIEAKKASLWQSFLDSYYREDLEPYTSIRRTLIAAKTLFAKNDFFGANHKLIWR